MYDNHMSPKEYHRIKRIIIDMINGDDVETDIDDLVEYIQSLYEDGEIAATQYDDLMRNLEEFM